MATTFGPAGAYLAPSAVIGLGKWGREVARLTEAALRDRSPALARVCPVLAIEDEEPAALELIRALLRASRMADVIRALEREGLMQLDPVLPPPSCVYFVCSRADDPRIERLRAAVEMVSRAAGELKATAVKAAIVDLGPDDEALPEGIGGLALYAIEPVTAHGLVLDPEEYRAAAVEALVAVAQPGGSSILAGPGSSGFAGWAGGGAAGGSVGTLGIAWLPWNPGDLRAVLAHRLSRDAVRHCLSLPAGGRVGAEQHSVTATRLPALLEGLPFRPAFAGRPEQPALTPSGDLFGDAVGRQHKSRHLRRCGAALTRRVERWQRRLQANATRRAEAEEAALQQSLAEALKGGPDGVARALALLDGVAAEGTRRPDSPAPEPLPRLLEPLQRVERAEQRPELPLVGAGAVLVAVLSTLVGRKFGATWPTLTVWWMLLALGVSAYHFWRPHAIERATEAAVAALSRRATLLLGAALQAEQERLDLALEERCRRRKRELIDASATLARRCDVVAASGRGAGGALAVPMLTGAAVEPLCARQQALVPDLARHLAAAGCLRLIDDPDALLSRAEALTGEFLAERLALDPGQVAAQAWGDRMAERLHEAVDGLLQWCRPLLARGVVLPEGQRWLLWPEGLPCPKVAGDVAVLPGARGCTAALTVINGLPAQHRIIRPTAGGGAAETAAG